LNVTPGYTICGHGPAVILLHSSMSSKDQWKPLIGLLRTNFTIIAIDLTGYGENKLPLNPQTFSLDDEIKLVRDILAKEKINNAHMALRLAAKSMVQSYNRRSNPVLLKKMRGEQRRLSVVIAVSKAFSNRDFSEREKNISQSVDQW